MPKEIHEIKTFVSGTVTTPDAKDIPEDAAESSLNIDPTSSDGRIVGIGNDTPIMEEIETQTSETLNSNVMGIVNVDSKRMLIGVDEANNTIKSIESFYDSDVSMVSNQIDNIDESSIVVDDNQAYIGLGKKNASRPKFAGMVSNEPFGRTHEGILVEDAEAKRYLANYYGIRKIATTIPATSETGATPAGNTGTIEDDYVWGLAPGERFLFRIDVNSDNNEGTITASDYIKNSNGINISSRINSIATCISQNNMLWATTNEGHILRLHVNASTLEVTVQLDIIPYFNKPSSDNASTDRWNFYNKPPPPEAILSDIIEARSPVADDGVSIKHDLVISYWKEDGFLPNESYIYRKHLDIYYPNDTVDGEELLNPFIVDASVLDTDEKVVTQYVLENMLFKDISVIFSEVTTTSTKHPVFGTMDIAMQYDDGDFLGSRVSGNAESIVKLGTNTVDTYNWHSDFPIGTSFRGKRNINFSSKERYDHKLKSNGDVKYDDDGNYIPEYTKRNGNKIYKGGYYSTSGLDTELFDETDGHRFNLGRNIGFSKGFKLYVHRFGLISLYNTIQEEITAGIDPFSSEAHKDDVYVGLFAYSDKSFCANAGTVRSQKFISNAYTFGNSESVTTSHLFFGEEECDFYNLNNGFFITINSTQKYRPWSRHRTSDNSLDFGINLGDSHPMYPSMAISSVPWDILPYNQGEAVGTSLIGRLSTNTDDSTNGGYADLIPSNIDSISMDRFGNRATTQLTTTSNYKTPADNENLCFLSEAVDTDSNDHFDSTKFWSVNFDGLTLDGGNTYTTLEGQGLRSGIDVIKQAEQSNGTYIESKLENNLGGACIFTIFNSANTVGGQAAAGDGHHNLWYFSLYSTDTSNYSNGVYSLLDASAYNDWGSLTEKITTYALMTFEDIEGDAGNHQFQENAELSYKLALVYDNGAISKLTKQERKHPENANYLKSIFVTINISPESLSPRVSAIQLYRRGGTVDGELSDTWQLAVNNIQLSEGWSPIDNSNEEAIYFKKTIADYNNNIASYENESGLEVGEVTEHTLPNYSLSTIVNGSNIIGKCFLPNFDDLTNTLFKSNAGRYNHFNIADPFNFLKLPTTPTGLKGFAGRLFAFDENNTYIINTESMTIEDELEGIGCLGKNSVISTEFGMFFADDSNIYQYDGQKTIPLANSILKSNNKTGWLERRKDFNPIVGFDGSKLSLVVIHRQHHNLTDEEVQEIVNEILTGDNPDGLTVFDIIEMLDGYFAWVYNLRLKRWDRWQVPGGVPLSSISGKDGELIISTSGSLVFYGTNLEDRRNWEWISKHITLAEDGKYKKFYSIISNSNSDTNSFIEYKVDGNEFKALSENGLINSQDRKSKIIQIKLTSTDDDLEVDSLSLTYRRLPNTTNNV